MITTKEELMLAVGGIVALAVKEARIAAYVEFRDKAMDHAYDDLWDICAELIQRAEGCTKCGK